MSVEEDIEILASMVKARNLAGLTQKELAFKMGLPAPAICRLEKVSYIPSIQTRTLKRYFKACGFQLKITFNQIMRAKNDELRSLKDEKDY